LLEAGEGSSTTDTVKWAFVSNAEQDLELHDGWRVAVLDVDSVTFVHQLDQGA